MSEPTVKFYEPTVWLWHCGTACNAHPDDSWTCRICGRVWPMEKADQLAPTIVTLCGSARFWHAFQEASLMETLRGKIVLTVGTTSATGEDHYDIVSLDKRDMLGSLHFRKIDLSSEILVIDVGGYIGPHTHAEIEYARSRGKRVRYLSKGE